MQPSVAEPEIDMAAAAAVPDAKKQKMAAPADDPTHIPWMPEGDVDIAVFESTWQRTGTVSCDPNSNRPC